MLDAPAVKRLADALRVALAGQRILRFHTAWRRLQCSSWPEVVAGLRLVEVASIGKNLLFHLEGGVVLFTHLSRGGRWELLPRGPWSARRDPRVKVSLTLERCRAVLYHGPIFEVLEERALASHAFLSRLGPCVLALPFDAALFARRLTHKRHLLREIADVLFDREVVAGIGNCLKSESLFEAGISPFRLAGRLDDGEQRRLGWSLSLVSQRAYRQAGRTLTDDDLALLGAIAAATEVRRHYVYGLAGAACLRCQTPIQRRRHGVSARLSFFCPTCQPED
ncbi:MAG: hypothetical protein HYY96_07580 [Candidatus Tectomicrobia bacterium]|nr:hypothetical protein [Candidatus Tectomicrobia bacterium]